LFILQIREFIRVCCALNRANIYFVTAYESEVENVRCLHRTVYSADWTAGELIHHMTISVEAVRHCSLLTFSYKCSFVGCLWGNGICLHPFYCINDDDDDDDDDDDGDGDVILRNVNILLVEEKVYRTVSYSIVSYWF
jgi:hypothetical protein